MRVILFETHCTEARDSCNKFQFHHCGTATDQIPYSTKDFVATMSKTVVIQSTAQFKSVVASSKIVVADCRYTAPASSTAKR